jgi:hypothetical protein
MARFHDLRAAMRSQARENGSGALVRSIRVMYRFVRTQSRGRDRTDWFNLGGSIAEVYRFIGPRTVWG